MGYLNNLSDVSPTQVLAKGLVLNELLKEEFLDELKSKLKEDYEEFITADIRLILIPKKEKSEPKIKEDEKGVIIQIKSVDFLRLEQPSQEHLKEKTVVLTSNRREKLDKLLSK